MYNTDIKHNFNFVKTFTAFNKLFFYIHAIDCIIQITVLKMDDQENLMDKLTTFLDIFKALANDFDIINLNSMVDLTCGCRKPVYLIMIQLGCQVKYCETPICREHDWEHQFSCNRTMKDICVQFFDLNLKNPNSPYHFTLHPRR